MMEIYRKHTHTECGCVYFLTPLTLRFFLIFGWLSASEISLWVTFHSIWTDRRKSYKSHHMCNTCIYTIYVSVCKYYQEKRKKYGIFNMEKEHTPQSLNKIISGKSVLWYCHCLERMVLNCRKREKQRKEKKDSFDLYICFYSTARDGLKRWNKKPAENSYQHLLEWMICTFYWPPIKCAFGMTHTHTLKQQRHNLNCIAIIVN